MRRALPLLAALSGCRGVEQVRVDAPPEVELIALLSLDDAGGLRSASPLVRFEERDGLLAFVPAEGEVLVVGYAASALAPLSAEELARAPLRPPGPCEATLPTPRWAAHLRGAALDPAGLPALASDAWSATCPGFDPARVVADVDCLEEPCLERGHRVGACGFALDLGACGGRLISGSVGADGRACALAAADWPCFSGPAPATLTCPVGQEGQRCTIALHHLGPSALQAERLAVGSPGRYFPGWLDYNGNLRGMLLTAGHLADLAPAAEGVLVVRRDGEESCPSGPPGRSYYRRQGAGLVRTASAPDCLDRLLALESGELLGLYVEGGAWRLGRLDVQGRPTASVPLDPRTRAAAGEPPVVTSTTHRALALSRAGDRLLVLMGSVAGLEASDDGSSHLLVFDLSLAPRGLFRSPRFRCWAVAGAGPGRAVLTCAELREAVVVSLADGRPLTEVGFVRHLAADEDSLLDVVAHPASQRLLVAAVRPGVSYLLDANAQSVVDQAILFERPAAPVTALPWPMDQELLLVGLVGWSNVAGLESFAALLDPRAGRFLPGLVALGPGMVTRLAADPSGAVWALLPWSAEVVRVTPAERP